jgi:hypothetical protein
MSSADTETASFADTETASFADTETASFADTSSLRMEINGRPFYIKTKNNVPYIYDIDTHDQVGYWSSKKGAYVMFSLYNKLMNDLKQKSEGSLPDSESDSSSSSSLDEEYSEEEGEEDEGEEDEEEESEEEESDSEEEESDSEEEESEEEESEEEESEEKCEVITPISEKQTTTYSIVMLFFVLFIYLTLQKEFQTIYFDFVFIILINLLNTSKAFEILNDE